jgi:hypothetical protein
MHSALRSQGNRVLSSADANQFPTAGLVLSTDSALFFLIGCHGADRRDNSRAAFSNATKLSWRSRISRQVAHLSLRSGSAGTRGMAQSKLDNERIVCLHASAFVSEGKIFVGLLSIIYRPYEPLWRSDHDIDLVVVLGSLVD